MSMNLSNIAILNIKGSDYHCKMLILLKKVEHDKLKKNIKKYESI